MLTKLSKSQEKALRYIDRARYTKDDQEALKSIRSTDILEAADGWRYYAANTSLDNAGEFTYDKPGSIVDLTSTEDWSTLPNLEHCMPTDEAESHVTVNSKFLREALTGLTGPVTLTLYGNERYIEVQGLINTGCNEPSVNSYALIMPLHASENTWKPYQEEDEEPVP